MQTKKHRPSILVGEMVAKLFEGTNDYYIGVRDVKKSFGAMAKYLELPADGQSGTKLIRRSVSTLARKKLGEDAWAQGRRMLGHYTGGTSDIYALSEPGQLGKVLAVTNEIIEEICALAPGAFDVSFDRYTRLAPDSEIIKEGI